MYVQLKHDISEYTSSIWENAKQHLNPQFQTQGQRRISPADTSDDENENILNEQCFPKIIKPTKSI